MAISFVLGRSQLPHWTHKLVQGAAAAAVLACLTWGGFAFQINLLTISLLYLMVVVGVASFFGFWQASFASIVAVLLLDYYFEPPLFSFRVASSGILVALATFEATALAISRLHGREMREARQASAYRGWMEQLYELSRSSLLLDLRKPPGPQLAVLIQRIFGVRAVFLYDARLGRQDRAGDWAFDEDNLARESFLRGEAWDDLLTETSSRILRAAVAPVGALVVRGRLSPLTMDAIASLAAMATDRHYSIANEDKAETAKKAEELRAAVMDALAHEFKTPLTAVQTASSGLLELGGLTDGQAEMVKLIEGEADRLTRLCTDLLKAAKVPPVQADSRIGIVDLRELISEVIAGTPLEERRNRVQLVIEESAANVRVTRELLVMILKQYIDNAHKYSTPGTPIEITAYRNQDEILISVHTVGPTIRIEDRERIFERFYRSENVRDAIPGTGIGLSVVKKAADAHHGHVWVISDEKEGTTFFVSLPDGTRSQK